MGRADLTVQKSWSRYLVLMPDIRKLISSLNNCLSCHYLNKSFVITSVNSGK